MIALPFITCTVFTKSLSSRIERFAALKIERQFASPIQQALAAQDYEPISRLLLLTRINEALVVDG
jgi:hypothetical protein